MLTFLDFLLIKYFHIDCNQKQKNFFPEENKYNKKNRKVIFFLRYIILRPWEQKLMFMTDWLYLIFHVKSTKKKKVSLVCLLNDAHNIVGFIG